MKKFYFLICLLAMSLAGIGQQLLSEPFNYTPDPTNGLFAQSAGVWSRVNTGDSILVTSGSLSYTGLPASTGNKVSFDGSGSDYYTSFTSQTSGTVYGSFILNVSSLGTLNNTTGGYFASFIQDASTSAFGGVVWLKASTTTVGKYNIGVSTRSSNSPVSWLTNDLDLNTSYFVVIAYEMVSGTANDVAKIWLNTTAIGGTEPAADATAVPGTSDLASVARFLLRQDNATNTPFIDFDELRVGTTWASVTPSGTVTIPTPTTTSISPSSATAGGTGFNLSVFGTNFISGQSTVTWNGSNLVTTFVSATELTAAVPASNITTAGTAQVGVTTTGAAASSNTQTFTINAVATPVLSATSLTAFGNVCINTTSAPNSFTITGNSLTAANITVGPLAGYSFSTTSGGTYTPSLTLTQPGGSYSQQIFVEFTPTAVQSYSGDIPVAGGGASSINVAVTGAGVNTAPTVTAGAATSITTTGATLPGTITDAGCTTISAYGIEYSLTSGFANGTGTSVAGSNLAAGNFSVNLSTLAPATTYYYKTWATNAAGTSYSSELSFITTSPTAPSAPVATAATAVTSTGFTANWNAVAGATNYRLDVYTLAAGGVTDIAGWNFATNTAAAQTADVGNANNIGIQTVTPNGLNTISWPGGPSGSSGTPNPYSVSANGWDNGMNTKYWQIDVNTTGATNITLSSLQGSSSTGPSAFKVQYKVGAAGTWTDVTGGTVTLTTAVSPGTLSTWGSISNLALPSAVDNQPLVSIRWISTSNTAVNGSAVSATGTSRISAIYVKGSSGSGTTPVYVTGYQDLSVGNVTSYAVTGLTSGTTYYYVVRAENAGGISANSNDISVTTVIPVIPTITNTSLTGFGNQCVNTTSTAANTFTINGTNLTNANITVGPLAGYLFATTAGGPFTPGLSLTQAGGTYSQQVYVVFNPTAVQSYNGDIPVAGGGTSSATNVAVTGAGVNTTPSVTTGGSSAVTNNAATLAGSITATGCSAISAYGIEYSTTSNFPNGTGTQVTSTNLAGGNFTSSLTGLNNGITYYYKAYATNAGGTDYGTEQSFTTLAAPPASLSATALTGFGSLCINNVAGPNSFTISGTNLTAANITVGPLAGYTFSTSANGTYSNSLNLTQPGGTYSQVIYVKFNPTAAQTYNGNIPVGGGGASTINVAVTGTGTNGAPAVTTNSVTSITTSSAILSGAVTAQGCSAVQEYGFEYSVFNNFTPGTGIKAATASGVITGAFTKQLNGLVQGTTYYFRAYATNAGGTAYGEQQSFVVLSIPDAFTVYPNPVLRGREMSFSMNNLKLGYVGIEIYNNAGQQVYRKHFNNQNHFINERITMPYELATGIYTIRIVNDTEVLDKKTILIID